MWGALPREKILDGITDNNARVMRVRMVGDSEGAFPGDVVEAAGGASFVVGKGGGVGVAGAGVFLVGGTGLGICTVSGGKATRG